MASILQVTSPQPSRLTVALDSAPSTTASNYTITRANGNTSGITVSLAFLRAANVVELCLDSPLLEGVEYLVAVSGAGSAAVAYRSSEAATPAAAARGGEDVEASVFGRDIAWITASLGPGGRVPVRSGIEAWLADCRAVALTSPGEIVHRPKAGVGLLEDVNGPPSLIDEERARMRSSWARDPRTLRSAVDVQVADDGGGEVYYDAVLTPAALPNETYPLSVTR